MMMMKKTICCLFFALCLWVCNARAGPAGAPGGRGPPGPDRSQPPPPPPPPRPIAPIEISMLDVRTEIGFRFAQTHMVSKMYNPAWRAQEGLYQVTLPQTAFISNFSMIIDGVTIYGDVKDKDKARKEFEEAKCRGESAGHVAATERDSNKFHVNINVAAKQTVVFHLIYHEVLQRHLGFYDYVLNIDPGNIVPELRVNVYIKESRPITKLIVPPIKRDGEIIYDHEQNPAAVITRQSDSKAHIEYKPSVEMQRNYSAQGIAGKFIVRYDVMRGLDIGDIQMVNGYFIHTFAPAYLPPIPKNILFILDVSGSMGGTKIRQLKEAMYTILNEVRHEDKFNIIKFSSQVYKWMRSMIPATAHNIDSAKTYISGMIARGGTAINAALTDGINSLDLEHLYSERPSVIVFLTDGMPTVGETNTNNILRNIRNLNEGKYPIFSLGFGNGVNFEFLKKLSLQNGGFARKIYEASDAAMQLKDFYQEISIPLLFNITFTYKSSTGSLSQLSKTKYKTYFSGSEIIVTGKVDNAQGPTSMWVCCKGQSVGGYITICPPYVWPPVLPPVTPVWVPETGLARYIERMWAYLTIQNLLEEAAITYDPREESRLKQQALDLSLQFHFVTPLTSMVVTLPQSPRGETGKPEGSKGVTGGLDEVGAPGSRCGPPRPPGIPGLPGRPAQKGQVGQVGPSGPSGMPGSHGRPGPIGPPGLPGQVGQPGPPPPRPPPRPLPPRMTRGPVVTTTPPPVINGAPSMAVQLSCEGCGKVCLSWPEMSLSTHNLLTQNETSIYVSHGRTGDIDSVTVVNGGTSYIISPSSILGSQLHSWGTNVTTSLMTIEDQKVKLNFDDGMVAIVYNMKQKLFLELPNTDELTSPTGMLENVQKWTVSSSTLTTDAGKEHTTTTLNLDDITCSVTSEDIFDITNTERRA